MARNLELGVSADVASEIEKIAGWVHSLNQSEGLDSAWCAECDGEAIWLSFRISSTSIEGLMVEPFVHDFGGGLWIQGWSDGSELVVAVPEAGVALALSFLRGAAWPGPNSP